MKVNLNFTGNTIVQEPQKTYRPHLGLLGLSTGVVGYAMAESFTKLDIVDIAKKGANSAGSKFKYSLPKSLGYGAVLGAGVALTHSLLSKDKNSRRRFTDIMPIETALLAGGATWGITEAFSRTSMLKNLTKNADNIAKIAKNTTGRNVIIAGVVALGAGMIHKVCDKK